MKRHYVLGMLIAWCIAPISASAVEPGFYLGVEAGQSRARIGMGDSVVASLGAVTGTSSDERDTTLGLYVGYTLSNHFAIEFSYADLGESAYTIERETDLVLPPIPTIPSFRPNPGTLPPFFTDVPGSGVITGPVFIVPEREETTIDSQSFALTLVGRYALTERVSFIGRAGLSAHLLDANLRFWFDGQEGAVRIGDLDESAAGGLVGIGVEWDFHSSWHLRVQAQRHFMLEDASFINNVERGDVTTLTGGIGYRF